MKKGLFFIIVCIMTTSLYGYTEGMKVLSSKVIFENKNGYFVLSDRTCWKVTAFSKRWRSLGEWWSDAQLVPESYETFPSDWTLGSEIEIYPKYGNQNIFEENAANQEELKKSSHLLLNTRTGKILFATLLEPAECMLDIFNQGYDEGHKKGFDNGYSRGKTDGYREGLQHNSRNRS